LKAARQNGTFTLQTGFGWRTLHGVDPYYLAQKHKMGLYPEIILAGRRLNDSMGDYVAS
jgi:UDP-N-acetyl-D-mannosaminuronate dehydrogenase